MYLAWKFQPRHSIIQMQSGNHFGRAWSNAINGQSVQDHVANENIKWKIHHATVTMDGWVLRKIIVGLVKRTVICVKQLVMCTRI